MAQLRAVVKAGHADIGFAHDADGERLGIVSEAGEPLSEEMTLTLAAEIKLSQKSGPVVTNISTSSAIDHLAARHGASVIRTPVGQAYVSEAILEYQAVIGGEGNGGVIYPKINFARDSLVGMALILHLLAESGQTVSEILNTLPRYRMVKEKTPCPSHKTKDVLKMIQCEYASFPLDTRDGVKVSLTDGWFLVRGSNTEPIVRVVAEAETEDRARQIVASVFAQVQERINS